MEKYRYTHLRINQDAQAEKDELLASEGFSEERVWGVFVGLFGMGSDELIIVEFDPPGLAGRSVDHPHERLQSIHSECWTPTARPESFEPCTAEGLYVFRRFLIDQTDVEEFVSLSTTAWQTFEGAAEFTSSPQGLFRPDPDVHGCVDMALCTWYEDFASWERSRRPDPLALENFRRRQKMTHRTSAIATQLVKRDTLFMR